MPLQINGDGGKTLQVDTKHEALRQSGRPLDYGSLGSYRFSALSGQIAATLAAASELFQFRWSNNSGKKSVLTRLRVGVVVDGNITTAVPIVLEGVLARSFTVSGSGGTALTLTGNNGKLKTDMGTTLVGDARIATTAALSAGTKTLDTQGFGMAVGGTGTTAGALTALAMTDLFNPKVGEENPLVLSQDEGFIIRSVLTGPATGTFRLAVDASWTELTSYDSAITT